MSPRVSLLAGPLGDCLKLAWLEDSVLKTVMFCWQTQKGDLKLIMENDLTKIMEFQLSCSSLCVFLGCSSEPDEGDAKHEVHRLEI